MSAVPCSPNEMPVNEGASGTVRVKKKKINLKKKKKRKAPGVFTHHHMGGGGGAEAMDVHTAGLRGAGS